MSQISSNQVGVEVFLVCCLDASTFVDNKDDKVFEQEMIKHCVSILLSQKQHIHFKKRRGGGVVEKT